MTDTSTADPVATTTGGNSDNIAALLDSLRGDANAALDRLKHHHDRAAELRAAADAETRAYAAAYRAIRARGWFTAAQLRGLGFAEPRTRARRTKPAS